jgi:GAF domain-containing protein
MVYFVILNNVAIGLMQFVYQDFTETSIALGLFIPYSLLTLIVMRHRNNVERDRIAAHEQLNHDLTILRQELEQTVQERTIKLEERVRQLHVITEVARTAASFQDIDRLLNSSTRLISESFGFYHVGIFLLDDLDQYAVLRAANSEGGQAMLAKMHTLPVDLTSIVGYVAKTQTPRIVLDTTADTVYFNNPDLPETRSEMAVPLKVGIRLIGILDVQSTHKDAFTEDDISILGTLGDQLAIAIDNTRLLTETRRALISAEQTYQRYFSQAWSQFASHYSIEGYRYHNGKLDQLREAGGDNQEDEGNMSKLRIPLMVRGQSIGILEVQPADGKQEWNPNELALLETTAERAALALENARLLEDAQRRAARESTISKISSKIGETSETEKIMAAAVAELRQALGAAEVVLNLNTDHQTK